MTPFRTALSALLALLLAPAAGAQVTIVDIENRSYTCRELSMPTPGQLDFSDQSGRSMQLPCDRIAEILWPKDPSRPQGGLARFQFTSGDVWVGELAAATETGVRIKSPDLGLVEVRFDRLYRIVFAGGDAAIPAGQGPEDEDVMWKRNKDSDRGAIRTLDDKSLTMQSSLFGDKDIVTGIGDVAAIQFAAGTAPEVPKGLLAILTGQRGTRVTGVLQAVSRTHVVLTSLYDPEERISVAVGCVASLHFKNGRVVYLSDLEPEATVERPFFETSDRVSPVGHLFPYRRDAAVTGGRLSVEGTEYRKGLGVHAYSELRWTLDGEFERFQAVAGIDDSAAPTELAQPSVAFSVLVDGKKVWESGIVLWNSAAAPVNLPVKGARQLTLIVDFAGDGDCLDRADWAGARLIR